MDSDGQLIKRPGSPIVPASPGRAYQPGQPRINYSPERPQIEAASEETAAPRAGLRRRASHQNSGEYDTRPSSSRPMRSRGDDGYHSSQEDERAPRSRHDDYHHHPDSRERSRPPRSYRNAEWDRPPPSASKPYFDESRHDYNDRDLERGEPDYSPSPRRRRASVVESIDGYNYYAHRKGKVDFKSLSKEEQKEILRLPWTEWMNSEFKNHFVATLGEFVGTTMFLFFAFAGTQVANIQSAASSTTTSGGATGFNISVYLYISVIFGFSLMVNVWIFFRISGGLFNPAVTLAMVLVGAVPPLRAIFLFNAQIVGAIAASGMVIGMFPTSFNVRTTLSGGSSLVQGVFIEAILTAELVFTIFMLAKEKHKATFIAPVGIGLALFIAEMVGVYYTGGSLNPARSIGPCIVTWTWDKEHWIYWVGPFIGSLIAVVFYRFIKMLEYEMANPGQDGDDVNDPTKNPEKRHEIQHRREQKQTERISRMNTRD
ncbi:hypothetical protein HYFRA_00009526 [Hymenoscyphus fraxineus]|uniref:Aquaporin-like protein n=1 Tax=Hymenoscyphus fraxineus TaxID=746836 RepID=A0A9N9L1Y5_9HELO|nr:hypothetical protein HYFRA_00009526 [Hymenoscyphus fraxineus]